jgi:ribonuclease Y
MFCCRFYRKIFYARIDSNSIEQTSDRIINEAKILADAKTKQMLIEGKEAIDRERRDFDKELKEKKIEVQNSEKRLLQREESLDKRMDSLDKRDKEFQQKEKNLQLKEKTIDEKIVEVETIKNEQKAVLEKISGITREEAKQTLMKEMLEEAKRDAVVLAQRLEQDTRENANKKAKEIISLAIQKSPQTILLTQLHQLFKSRMTK